MVDVEPVGDGISLRGRPPLDVGPTAYFHALHFGGVRIGRRSGLLVAAGSTVLGAGLLVGSVGEVLTAAGDLRGVVLGLLGALVGAGWAGSLGYGFWYMYVRRRALDGARVSVEHVDGRSALVLRWSRFLVVQPTATVTFLVGLGAAGAVLGAQQGVWVLAVALGVPAVLLALVLPDSWARLRRRPCLVLAPEGVTVHGWDGTSSLGWEDVTAVGVAHRAQWLEVRLDGRPGASTWAWAPARRLLVRAPKTPHLQVPLPAVDVDPDRLVEALELWCRWPLMRRELADVRGRDRLV